MDLDAPVTGELGPISRLAAPVRTQVVQMIREAIFSRALAPGERLVERDLCERTGASRTSIREAIRQLESEGLVTVVPNRGPIVTVVSSKSARDMYELREVLEDFIMRLFCSNATPEHMTSLRQALAAVEAAVAANDPRAAMIANNELYGVLLEGAGNSALATTVGRVHGRISYLRNTSLSMPGRLPKMLGEMAALCDALERRDAKAASRLSKRHLASASAAALAAIEASGSSEAVPAQKPPR